jgi:hypothetical protein
LKFNREGFFDYGFSNEIQKIGIHFEMFFFWCDFLNYTSVYDFKEVNNEIVLLHLKDFTAGLNLV